MEVVQQRVEAYNPPERFATVVSRAFATIADMLAGAGRLCSPGGRIIAMKGVFPEAELAALPPDYRVEEVREMLEGAGFRDVQLHHRRGYPCARMPAPIPRRSR